MSRLSPAKRLPRLPRAKRGGAKHGEKNNLHLDCHCERSEAISSLHGDCFVAALLAMTSAGTLRAKRSPACHERSVRVGAKRGESNLLAHTVIASEAISSLHGDCFVAALLAMTTRGATGWKGFMTAVCGLRSAVHCRGDCFVAALLAMTPCGATSWKGPMTAVRRLRFAVHRLG